MRATSEVRVRQQPGYRGLPAFQLRDLPFCLVLPPLALIAWIVPEGWWPNVCRGLVHLCFLGPGLIGRTLLHRIRTATGKVELPVNCSDICVAYVANRLLLQLQYFRSFRPDGWRARLNLTGREHLDAALHLNNGVILWVMPATSSDLVVRRCLAESGYPISHLTTLNHGWSNSRLGVRYINAPGVAIGNRYLRARIILVRDTPAPALSEIERRLAANEVVSITAVENSGRKSVEVPILSARLPLGVGALSFGYKTGAPVLPVFCVRHPDGSYQVRIEPSLPIDLEKGRQEAVEGALAAFGRQVEKFALEYPDQWYGWNRLRIEEPERARSRRIWDDWVVKTAKR